MTPLYMKKHYVYYLRRYRRRTVIQAGKKQQEGKCSFSNLTIIRDLTSYLICQKGRNLKSQLLLGSQFWVLLLHALPALHFRPSGQLGPSTTACLILTSALSSNLMVLGPNKTYTHTQVTFPLGSNKSLVFHAPKFKPTSEADGRRSSEQRNGQRASPQPSSVNRESRARGRLSTFSQIKTGKKWCWQL